MTSISTTGGGSSSSSSTLAAHRSVLGSKMVRGYITAVLLLLVCGDDLLSTFSTQNDACCNMRHLVASAQRSTARRANNASNQRNTVPCNYLRGTEAGGVSGTRRGNRCTVTGASRETTDRLLGRSIGQAGRGRSRREFETTRMRP